MATEEARSRLMRLCGQRQYLNGGRPVVRSPIIEEFDVIEERNPIQLTSLVERLTMFDHG
jgi:hypothetical protein